MVPGAGRAASRAAELSHRDKDSFDTERFIIEIKSRAPIWDSSTEEYSNKRIKKKCWEEIVELFAGSEDSISEKRTLGYTLQKRWKNIRGCFVRELNRKKSLKTGSPTNRKSEYIYFQQLLFLQNAVANKDAQDGSIDSEDSNEMKREMSAERNESRIKKKKSTDSTQDAFLEALQRIVEQREALQEYEQRESAALESDGDRMFLLSLLTSLNKIPESRKLSTKIEIMSVINRALH